IEEDQVNDSERNHTTESVCWFAADSGTAGNLRAFTTPEPSISLGSEQEPYELVGTTYNLTAINPVSVSSWDSFTETATLNGQSIDYELSNDGGSTWYYWNGGSWASTTTQYNGASVVNSNISAFPVGGGTLTIKARLNSDGSATPELDEVGVTFS
ncbi:MAG: hypothetical protein GOV15_03005, partial [Candidatus Diapherotrites archaeon]|nr:hypothetical protein [Candidatus Diapherotrites archaeon]